MMRAMYLESPRVIVEKHISRPTPQADEVLVKIKSVGVCGSDIEYYEHGKIGDFVVKKPLILGHEASGQVVEVGENVTSLKVGDRVALEPGVPCRKCEFCKTGRYNLCPDVQFMATPPVDGAFREYVAHPADFAFKVPEGVSYEEAALVEPLSVGIHAVERAQLKLGDQILIFGAGPIGLLTLQVALVKGVSRAVVLDINDARLKKAKELGADAAINARESNLVADLEDSFDVIFEAAGAPATISQALRLVKRGGTIVLIGHSSANEDKLDRNLIITKELNILGTYRYKNTYSKALRLMQKGHFRIASLIGKTFSLADVDAALRYPRENPSCIKAMVVIN